MICTVTYPSDVSAAVVVCRSAVRDPGFQSVIPIGMFARGGWRGTFKLVISKAVAADENNFEENAGGRWWVKDTVLNLRVCSRVHVQVGKINFCVMNSDRDCTYGFAEIRRTYTYVCKSLTKTFSRIGDFTAKVTLSLPRYLPFIQRKSLNYMPK